MAFGKQPLEKFIEAKDRASELLLENRSLRTDEALVLQAISHLLLTQDDVTANQIRELTHHSQGGSLHRMLRRFEEEFGVLQSEEVVGVVPGVPPRFYFATELGSNVLKIFQPSEQKRSPSK